MKLRFTGGSLDKGRLDTLVDAVYAIALTLLVLDLKVFRVAAPAAMPGAFESMLPEIGIYAIAFSTIALLWVCHHYYSTLVIGTDFTHVMLNLSPLLFISLVPFTAAAMGNNTDSSWAVAVFTLNVAIICFLYVLNWAHCRKRLVPAEVDRGLLDTMSANALYSLAGEILASILAFVVPVLGIAIAAVMVPAGFAAMARLEPRIMEAVKER